MRRSSFSRGQRVLARLVLAAVLNQWAAPMAFASQTPAQEPEPLPLASTVTAIPDTETTTFIDKSLIGKDGTELVGKWIRVYIEGKPAGLVTTITAFNSETGEITLQDPLPAGAVQVNDVYHLADSRDILLPATILDPATLTFGTIGCTPDGTANADTIDCAVIDTTGVDAKAGDDTVTVQSSTIVLVTEFGAPEDATNEDKIKSEAKAISLGDGADQFTNGGTVVSAAVSLGRPADPPPDFLKKDDVKAVAAAQPTAIGIDAGAGQNIITNEGTVLTAAVAVVRAGQVPTDETAKQKNADVSSSAAATSTGILSGDDGSFITNSGSLTSSAVAIAWGLGVSASSKDEPGTGGTTQDETQGGDFTFKGDVSANANASGITVGDGTDTVTNTDTITVRASANALDAGGTRIEAKGSAGASATAKADATAAGLQLGGGNDTVINNGTLTVSATARAIALEMAIADKNNAPTPPAEGDQNQTPDEPPQETTTLTSTVDGSATAKATATGIVADGDKTKDDGEPIFDVADGRITIGRESSQTREVGNDAVTNSGTIEVSATARSVASAGAVTVDGTATVKSTSTADATSLAIDLGGGDDTLTNSGTITSLADAIATALSVAVAQKASTPASTTPPAEGGTGTLAADEEEKNTVAIKTVIEGSATATSTATGITADGALNSTSSTWTASAGLPVNLRYFQEDRTTQVSGTDTVSNSGTIGVTATATTRAASLGVSAEGGATVKTTSTAEATALGIDLGGGNDTLTNAAGGQLTTTAEATANALALAIGFKTDEAAKAEVESAAVTNAEATARATGVTADGLQADTARTIELSLGGGGGLSLAIEKTTSVATGDDTVTNNGDVTTTATATTRAAGVAVAVNGKATTSVTSTATAAATAIDLGGGADTLTNTGTIAAASTATANALGVTLGLTSDSKQPASPSTPPTDGGETGATAASDETPAEATPATPVTLESSADVSAKATANATGVSADSATGDSTQRLALQLGGGVASSLTLERTSTYASGNDTVTNSGAISTTATATSRAAEGDVTVDGKAATKMTSAAEALAAGLNLGGGADTLTNTATGSITTTAMAIASGRSAALGIKADPNTKSTAESAVDASVEARATSVGIAADASLPDSIETLTIEHLEGALKLDLLVSETRAAGNDTLTSHGAITTTAIADAASQGIAVAIDGSTAAKNATSATADAAGIDGGGGHDTITSTGPLTATATATASSITLSLGLQQTSDSSGSTTTAAETSTETPIPTPAAATSKSTVDGSVSSTAAAAGLAADSLRGDFTITGSLLIDGLRSYSRVLYDETRASGDDTVTNNGGVTATATATSGAIAGGVSIAGQTTAKLTSTADATSAAIDLGGGHDTLTNTGSVAATSTATAGALSIALGLGSSGTGSSGSGSTTPTRANSSVDAGATADATAIGLAADGIRGDALLSVDLSASNLLTLEPIFSFIKADERASGDDTVTNSGAIEARATATTGALGAAVTTQGSASTTVSSSAEARATAIDLGAGADTLTSNTGALTSFARAVAGALVASGTNKGTASSTEGGLAASEGLWKGGVDATAAAFGIDGAGAPTTSTTIGIFLNGLVGLQASFEKREDNVTADGADTIDNSASITVDAIAEASALNVSVSAEGTAAAVSDVESQALAAGIRGGNGNDTIENFGIDLITTVTATANSNAGTFAVSGKGLAVAADTLWSTGTQATATAFGLDGDGGRIKSTLVTFTGDLGHGELVIKKEEATGSGNDTILNEQALTVSARAEAPSLGVAIEAKSGVAATVSSVETTASATGIRGGGGDDDITNVGVLLIDATALSTAATIAAAQQGLAAAGGAVWDGGNKATASAAGIDLDGGVTTTRTTTLLVDALGATITHEKKIEEAIGVDTLFNFASLTATATATADSLAAAGTVKGVSAAFAESTATSAADAIRAGGGNDEVTNYGELRATATSIATAVNVSMETTAGVAIAGSGAFTGGTAADARATGIAGDGGGTTIDTVTINVGGGDFADRAVTDTPATGNDTIVNEGLLIDVLADATAKALAVAPSYQGVGVAVTTSEARARATAIDAAGGDDSVTSTGTLIARAVADAWTGNVTFTNAGLSVSVEPVWNGGTRAEASARGIDNGQGTDTITNSGAITATSSATSGSGTGSLASAGAAVAVSASTATARAAAIDDVGGSGDSVTNTGTLTATANANALAASVSIVGSGAAGTSTAVWNGETTAEATARGIAVATGGATIVNVGAMDIDATALTGGVNVSSTTSGVAAAVATGTARADATAIDTGAGSDTDTVINTGVLDAKAFAGAATVDVGLIGAGLSVAGDYAWDGGTRAEAAARGINGGAGGDEITNHGDVTAQADSSTVSLPVSWVTSGAGVAVGTSTAVSRSAAIDAGTGDNWVANYTLRDITGQPLDGQSAKLTSISRAFAEAASITITAAGVSVSTDAVWDGGTTADATATGIRAGAGSDTIDNTGDLDVQSLAQSGSVSVGVTTGGVAIALAKSTALSNAFGIDASALADSNESPFGDDTDTVTNRGALTVDANAVAFSVPVAVIVSGGLSVAGTSLWDGGTTADARATGIATRHGDDVIENRGAITTDVDASSGSIGVSVSVAGVAAAVATSTATATTAAIDAGAGADRLLNTGRLIAESDANAGTVTVGVTPAGVAVVGDKVWDGGTRAEATSTAIAMGDGGDRVTNSGNVDALADARTTSIAVNVTVAGLGVSSATSTAVANATALDTGAGDDFVTNANAGVTDRMGKLTADATAWGTAAIVTVVPAGVSVNAGSVWDGGTTAAASAAGINTGLGTDTIRNGAELDVDAKARTFEASVPVTVYGVAAAVLNATATAEATGIKTGDNERDGANAPVNVDLESEKDTVLNIGLLTVDSDTWATSLGVGFTFGGVTGVANAVWDGGTTGHAFTTGIGLGNGADTVTNFGVIDAGAIARGVSAVLGINVFGVSAAVSTATGVARTTAIDGGDGNDTITNLSDGLLTADATATAVGVNVGFVAIGATVASDTVWNGGTKGDAVARGIGGGLGQDVITNDGTISSLADSDTASVSVTITGIGVGGALATSTATGTALAIDGGDDNDTIINRGDTTATTVAEGRGIAVSATGIGVGVSSDAFFKGGTTATAVATGIGGGAGDDTVWHLPESSPLPWAAGLLAATPAPNTVTADATSDAQSTQVTVTLGGFGGVAAGSTSAARATAIDGGDGDDDLFVLSDVVSNAAASAGGSAVSVTLVGAAAAGSLVDNATKAESIATGIAGGAGVDEITLATQATATLTSNANTKETAVIVNMIGLAAADSQAVATARATGIDGGDGNDTLINDGTVTGTLTSETKARSVSVTVTAATGNASGTAEVFGAGMYGGLGDDTVTNRGQIELTGTATARGANVSVTTTGVSDTDATSNSTAALAGVSGGAGADTLVNTGSIDATANAVGDSTATSVTLIVASFGDANTTANAAATGIGGGDDNDTLTNATGATVNATATASTTATDSTVTLVGAASGGSRTTPTGTSTGLDGGAGNDTIVNDGTVVASAMGTSSSTGSSFNLAGSSGTSAGATVTAAATGIAGGLGNDTLINRLLITASGLTSATTETSSWTLAGVAGDSSLFNATGSATGMAGDAGDDRLRNAGGVTVKFESTLTATGGSDAIFGGASGSTQLSAFASAFGMTGGTGNDTIHNVNDVDVRSKADVHATSARVSFAGSPDGGALLMARAESTGISGGLGDDRIRNDGAIRVLVESISNVSGGADAKAFGSASTSGIGTADGTGIGIQGNAGANTIVNAGSIDVDLVGDSVVSNSASSGLFFGNGNTGADARSLMSALGIVAGEGDNTIANGTTLDVTAAASGYAFATASGSHIAIKGDGVSQAEAQASARAVGIAVLGGANEVVNSGVMNVSALATTLKNAFSPTISVCTQRVEEQQVQVGVDDMGNPIYETQNVVVTECPEEEKQDPTDIPTYAGANGNGLFGDGVANAIGTATATAAGIRAGDGANTLVNTGELNVESKPEAWTTSFADGDAGGDATARSTSESRALAIGLQAGDGANEILNSGTIHVLAAPWADAAARATGGDICITFLFWSWCGGGGTGTGTAEATFNADAIGIQVGNGHNVIENYGALTVIAAPAPPPGSSSAPTSVANADTKARAVSLTSRAVGIQTGNGNNEIVNTADGVIDVEARDLPFSYSCENASGAVACTPRSLTAIGILTGSGNDTIVNDGHLSAARVDTAGVPQLDIAIDSGSGNDRVVLGSQSQTMGAIQLGTGNDRFVWSAGASLTGLVTPGAGTDTFALGGSLAGTLNLSSTNPIDNSQNIFELFEDFRKEGTSTWTLTGVRQMDWTVENGTLAIAGAVTGTVATEATNSLNPAVGVNATGVITSLDGSPAVLLQTNGVLVNDGSVAAAALNGVAVQALGQNSLVMNDGQIAGASTSVELSGTDSVLNNTGVILGGQNAAVAMNGADTTVVNHGDIQGLNVAVDADGVRSLVVNGGSIDAAGTALMIAGADSVVQNAGAITGGAGIMATGVDLTIVNSGSIAGGGVGLQSNGGNGLIVNDGSINAAGTALMLGGSGNVVDNDGVISGGGLGVALGGAGDMLTNAGTIASTSGLAIQGGSGSQQITNFGVLSGGAGFALDLGAGDDELTLVGNSLINGNSHGGDGIDTLIFGGTSSVLNLSTFATAFTSFENTLTQALLMTLVGDGAIDLTVEQGVLNVLGNVTGTVETSAAASGAQIFVQSDGSITSGDSGPAVVIQGANSLVNTGLIDGSIFALGSGSSISNFGVIENQSGVAIVGGDGAQQIENSGTIVSGIGTAIDFGGGDDLLQLTTAAQLGGDVLGGLGFDTLLLIGAGNVGLDLNTFDGFEMLQKQGSGLWLLSGSSNMAWNLAAGTIVLNGDLTGAGSIQPGALLAGNGLVGSLTNAGTVSPGMSIGTIGVVGDFVQTSTGILEIEGSIYTDVADKVNVTGRATLGGTLALVPESRPFGIATEYTVLEANGGVTGAFASTMSTAGYLDTHVDYLPQSVTVALVRNDVSFAAMGGTANLQALGSSLDANKRSMARGDFKVVMDEFLAMDAAARTSALRSMSGELHASLPTTLLRTGERFFSASASRRVSAQQAGERVTLWTDYIRFNGDVSGDGNATGGSYGASGLVGGMDFAIGSAARLGASLGYARAKSELDLFASDNASIRSLMPALYGEYSLGRVLVEGAFGYGDHDVRTTRQIEVGSIVPRQAFADYRADQYSGLLRVGFAVPTNTVLTLVPFVETRYSTLTRQAFDEIGAGSADLTGVGAFEIESLRTLVGVRTAWAPQVFGKRVEPALSLAWTHEGMDTRSGLLAALSGSTARSGFRSFSLSGVPDSRNGAFIDAGASIILATHGRAFVSYDGLLSDARTEHGLAAGLRIVW